MNGPILGPMSVTLTPRVDGGRSVTYATPRPSWRRQPVEPHALAQASEASLMLSAIGDAVYRIDTEGRIVYANGACEALLGWSVDELIGRHAHELLHHTHSDGHPYRREECPVHALHTPQIYRATNETYWRRDGTSFPADCTRTLIHVGDEVLGAVCAIADVSKSRQLVDRLGAQAVQQAAVANLGRRAVAEGTSQELMDDAVRAVADVLGVELTMVLECREDEHDLLLRSGVGWRGGVVGSATVSMGPETQAGYTLVADEPVLAVDLRTESRFRPGPLLREHGASSGISVVIAGDDRPFGVLTAHSRRQRAFEAHDLAFMQSIANVLAAAISRDRADRLQAALEHGRRLESLGELAGGIAHDFANLLSVIRNYTDFVIKDRDDQDAFRTDLDEIREAADRGQELTDQLLLFARRDEARVELIDVRTVVEETARMLSRTLCREVELRLELGEEPLPAQVDRAELQRSIVNLVLNARDAMAGRGTCTVAAAAVTLRQDLAKGSGAIPAGRYVRLSVSDTGGGMSEEARVRAFEPFFSTKGTAGTGLGLAIVYGVAARAGGHATLDSHEGSGTEVAIYLPLAARSPGSGSV